MRLERSVELNYYKVESMCWVMGGYLEIGQKGLVKIVNFGNHDNGDVVA